MGYLTSTFAGVNVELRRLARLKYLYGGGSKPRRLPRPTQSPRAMLSNALPGGVPWFACPALLKFGFVGRLHPQVFEET